ncbi:MAG: hypothetical protein ABI778_12265, partial [Ignavibacteriota bacterium]
MQKITWTAAKGTDSSKFIISGPVPPINPCYFDTIKHSITIGKIDSTSKGCFDFTFIDCLGHQSYATICLKGCPIIPHPDSLAPVFTLIKKWGTFDSLRLCDNNRVDSFIVTDDNKYDSGICAIDSIAGSVKNMKLAVSPYSQSASLVRFSVTVLDSMLDGDICLRAIDCSKEKHFTDTCIHYCTIPDTLAPRIEIIQTGGDSWHVLVSETAPWDRLIDSIFIVGTTPNIIPIGPVFQPVSYTTGASTIEFDVKSTDTTQRSSFCIEANDLAGNRSVTDVHCIVKSTSPDSLCPNIRINPPVNTNPTAIWVKIDDIHFLPPPDDTVLYVWDSGIDKVFFTGNRGMNAPGPINGNGLKEIDSFKISVINPMQIDSVACITINARDLAGNTCSQTYCYPYTPDTLTPIITLHYDPTDKSRILGRITDSTDADRGLDSIWLFHKNPGVDTNLLWTNTKLLGLKQFAITATNPIVRDPTQSSTGALWAIDRWGAFYSPISVAHTAKINFAIWVQDFKMKPALQIKQNTGFRLPVYFVKNDSIPVIRKGITQFSIGFTVIRDQDATTDPIVFDSVSTIKTEMEKARWNKPSWSPYTNGQGFVVKAEMGAGSPLDAIPLLSNSADSLVL